MKIIRALKIFLPVLLVAFVFTNCDMKDSSVGTFDDVADKLPNFTVMEGAENVTVRVQRNNDRAYFNVNLTNLGREAAVLDGDYLGWCAHWSAPIDTRGVAYEDITLYSTRYDKNWNKLNYLLNNRARFYNQIEGAGYKEIQAVIWSLIEFREFDIDRNQIFDDLNRVAFDAILEDVREHGDSFQHTPLTTHAIFADMSEHLTNSNNTQTVIVEGTTWAWAAPHTFNANTFQIHSVGGGGQWGWVTYYWFYDVDEDGKVGDVFTVNDPLKAGLYAGCGDDGFPAGDNPSPENIDNCTLAADVYIWHEVVNGGIDLKIHLKNRLDEDPSIEYSLTKVDYYIGAGPPTTAAPGQLGNTETLGGDPDFDELITYTLCNNCSVPSAPAESVFDYENGAVFPPVPPYYIMIHGDTN